jgi:hypothetical protein
MIGERERDIQRHALKQRLEEGEPVDVVDVAPDQLLEHSEQRLNLVVGDDLGSSSLEECLPKSDERRHVSSLLPQRGGQERAEQVRVRVRKGGRRVELKELREDLEHVGDELYEGRVISRSDTGERAIGKDGKVGRTDDVLLEDGHDGSKQLGLKLLERRDEGRDRLKRVLVELGVGRVLGSLTNDPDQVLEHNLEHRRQRLSGSQDDSHHT